MFTVTLATVTPARSRRAWWIAPLVLLLGLGVCTCLFLALARIGAARREPPPTGPTITISNPHHGDRAVAGGLVMVDSMAGDSEQRVTRVELWVDGELEYVSASQQPEGAGHLSAAQPWRPVSPGSHVLIVRAVNGRGMVGQDVIVIDVVEDGAALPPEEGGGAAEVVSIGLVPVVYVASGGETIEEVAEEQGVTEEEILALNPDLDAEAPLEEGQEVDVPFDPQDEEEAGGGDEQGGGFGGGPPAPGVIVPEPPEAPPPPGAPPDLIITNLTLSNLMPQPGEEIVVGVTIMNAGGSPAENFTWSWNPGNGEERIHDETPIPLLNPGDDLIREMNFVYTEAGFYTGRARADSRESVEEEREGNNGAQAIVIVGDVALSSPVDLAITNLTLSQLNPDPGAEIVVGVTIMNVGGSPAEDFYWAWNSGVGEGWVFDQTPIDYLAPGDDVIRELRYTYSSAGQFDGQAWVDAFEAYAEPHEEDNLDYATALVGMEDPFEVVDPLPEGPVGDVLDLLQGLGGDPSGGDESGTPPGTPGLTARTDRCDVILQMLKQGFADLDSFYVYRWDTTTGGEFELIAEIPAVVAAPGYRDTVPYPGEYYYQVIASNAHGQAASDIVRAQVTFDQCSALPCNTALLEVRPEGGVVSAAERQRLASVYCYAGLDDLPEERYPAEQGAFLDLDANGVFFDAGELGSRLVTAPLGEDLRVFLECWGWPRGANEPVYLGEFTNWHGEDEWNGQMLYDGTEQFQASYTINRVNSSHCVEVDALPYPPPPVLLGLEPAFRSGYELRFQWVGNENAIEGFWILCNGERAEWVGRDSWRLTQTTENGMTVYGAKLEDFLAFPDCTGNCNLSVVAGYQNEPFASDPLYSSAPSNEVANYAPPPCATVTVRFMWAEFPTLREDPAEVYGYLQAGNGTQSGRLTLGEGTSVDPGLAPRSTRPGEGWFSFHPGNDVVVHLNEDEELSVVAGFYDYDGAGLLHAEEDEICYVWTRYSPLPIEGWERVDGEMDHYLIGQSYQGSCSVWYRLLPGEPED